jgi:hypothetical protein
MVDEEELAAGEFAAVELVEHVKRMKAADMELRESGLWLVRNGSAHLRAVANRTERLVPKRLPPQPVARISFNKVVRVVTEGSVILTYLKMRDGLLTSASMR